MKILQILLALLLTASPVLAAKQSLVNGEPMSSSRAKINSNFTEVYSLAIAAPWLAQATAPSITNVFWVDTSGVSPVIKYWDGDSWEVADSGGGGTYTLPVASVDTSGGVKVGARLTITDGVLSADVQAGSVSDTAYGVGWNGDTTTAPSKNALYDKIETIAGGTMTYPGAGIGVSTGSAWGTSLVADGDAIGEVVVVHDDGSGNPVLPFTIDVSDLTDTTNLLGGSMTYPSSGNFGWTTNGTTWATMGLDTDLDTTSASDDTVPSAKAVKTALHAVSVAAPTVQSADPTSSSAEGWYAATGSGDIFYKSSAGLFAIAGTYTADPVTYTLSLDGTGWNATDSVTVGATTLTADGNFTGLSSATTAVTCTPDTGRTCSCTGSEVTGSAPNYVVDMSDSNESMACTFANAVSYLLNTDFEGTGTPSGWTTEYGSPNYDYTTTALAGSQSVYLDSQYERASGTFTASGTVHVSFVVQYSGAVSQLAIIEGTTSTELAMANTNGDIRVDDAGGYRGSCTVGAVDTPIYVWFDRTKGTGANETKSVYVATTDVKPGSACVTVTNGTGTDDYTKFNFRVSNTGTTIIGDSVQVQ